MVRGVLSTLPSSIVEHKSLRDRNNNRKIDFNWKIKTDFHSNACRFTSKSDTLFVLLLPSSYPAKETFPKAEGFVFQPRFQKITKK